MNAGLFGLRGTVALFHAKACPRALMYARLLPHVAALPPGATFTVPAKRAVAGAA